MNMNSADYKTLTGIATTVAAIDPEDFDFEMPVLCDGVGCALAHLMNHTEEIPMTVRHRFEEKYGEHLIPERILAGIFGFANTRFVYPNIYRDEITPHDVSKAILAYRDGQINANDWV
jgi:hypothetical protein